MADANLLHELPLAAAERGPGAAALTSGNLTLCYAQLADALMRFSSAVRSLGMRRGERVGIYLEKRLETVVASFGCTHAGTVMVPINPLLKPEQVVFIINDCGVKLLVTSSERLETLQLALQRCPGLQIVVVGAEATGATHWSEMMRAPVGRAQRLIDTDVAAILYTSGSTGKPKGVVLSHRNMVVGAKSVAGYLENRAEDTLLAALPLSFDAGFSQLTTAFHAGARVVLLNYLLPLDVLKAMARERVTGLTAVPPLYIQLSSLPWPEAIGTHLRYFANTGGRMPRETLQQLRERVPRALVFLMYGLTEAFRSTYLPPDEVDRRPDSIGKAIPSAEILVLREDGTECAPDEPGELVHRGALVGMGYWNDVEKTAERYKLLPGRERALTLPEYAVFSGDTVRRDAEGYFYYIGRRDEMIKTSGYRVSPTEVEDILYDTKLVGECVAFGVEHPTLGQAIRVIATAPDGSDAVDVEALLTAFKLRTPGYMMPDGIDAQPGPLPRNANGKIDRKLLFDAWLKRQAKQQSA